MNLDGITRAMCLVATFRRRSNPDMSSRRGGLFGCASGLIHGNAIGAGRNDVGGDVLYCATSGRCRIHEITARVWSVCGCLGRYRTSWRFCVMLTIFCVWLWRDRWPIHTNSKSSQLPALRLRSREGCARPYAKGGRSPAKHARHCTARGCSQPRERPAARPASNVTRMGMLIVMLLCMIPGQLLILGLTQCSWLRHLHLFGS